MKIIKVPLFHNRADINIHIYKIGKAAIAIRNSSDVTKPTVITQHQAEVTINGLTADEITSLRELEELMKSKMTGTGKKGTAQEADNMLTRFMADMENAKVAGFILQKWISDHRIWKCCQHYLQKNKSELKFDKIDNNEVWNKVVDEFINKFKEDAAPSTGSSFAGASNKFAVDVYCAAIARFKAKLPNMTVDDFFKAMEIVSAFLKMSSISKVNWASMIIANSKFKLFFSQLDEANQLYDNPGKITRPRLYACASSLFPAYEPLALFGVESRMAKIPKIIAAIYTIEKEKKVISEMYKSTSTSEHLIHLLLALGSTYPYVYNRNAIEGSVRNTAFNLN